MVRLFVGGAGDIASTLLGLRELRHGRPQFLVTMIKRQLPVLLVKRTKNFVVLVMLTVVGDLSRLIDVLRLIFSHVYRGAIKSNILHLLNFITDSVFIVILLRILYH